MPGATAPGAALGAAIEIDGLAKAYGGHPAVDHISMRVEPGEFLTLLGASGSGKTTTLMMIAGFVTPDAGTIRIDGRDIIQLPPERRGLGVVFQSYALFTNYDVFDNVAFPLRLRRTPDAELRRRVGNALALVDLSSFGPRRIHELSGGQQQRVALARAIVFAPPVLLMDEPLGALDRRLRDQLQTEIKRIQRDLNVTVVYVTHDQEEALALSDRIAIMRGGAIAQIGTPDQVYEDPASPFVASFLGESNAIPVRRTGAANGFVQTTCLRAAEKTVLGRLASGAQDGSDLVAIVRPEAMRVVIDGETGENRVHGKVTAREFLGATIRLQVRSEVGDLTIRIPRLNRLPNIGAGSEIEVAWRPQDTLLFATQQDART